MSYKMLMKTRFLTGPKLEDLNALLNLTASEVVRVRVHNPLEENTKRFLRALPMNTGLSEPLLDPSRFSSFWRLLRLYRRILLGIKNWKAKAGITVSEARCNYFAEASTRIIRSDQMKYFQDIFDYFENSRNKVSDIPPLVAKLNVFLDQERLLRVKSKLKKW